MPKQVEKWQADCGGCYDTEEQAIAAEKRALFTKRMGELYDQLGTKRPCDRGSYDRSYVPFIWDNRELILALLTETK